MRVLLWQDWYTENSRYLYGGQEVEVAARDGAAILQAGAGEVIRDGGVEVAVRRDGERAVQRRKNRRT